MFPLFKGTFEFEDFPFPFGGMCYCSSLDHGPPDLSETANESPLKPMVTGKTIRRPFGFLPLVFSGANWLLVSVSGRGFPLKINVEPKNLPIEKENHLPNLHFLGSMSMNFTIWRWKTTIKKMYTVSYLLSLKKNENQMILQNCPGCTKWDPLILLVEDGTTIWRCMGVS